VLHLYYALPEPWCLLVMSSVGECDRRRSVGPHPHVGIAHLGESLVAEDGVIQSDFRNRDEEKPVYSSV